MYIGIDQQPLDQLLLHISQRLPLNRAYPQDKFEHHQLVRHDHKHEVLRLLVGLEVLSVSVDVGGNERGDVIGGKDYLVEGLGDKIGAAVMLGGDL